MSDIDTEVTDLMNGFNFEAVVEAVTADDPSNNGKTGFDDFEATRNYVIGLLDGKNIPEDVLLRGSEMLDAALEKTRREIAEGKLSEEVFKRFENYVADLKEEIDLAVAVLKPYKAEALVPAA